MKIKLIIILFVCFTLNAECPRPFMQFTDNYYYNNGQNFAKCLAPGLCPHKSVYNSKIGKCNSTANQTIIETKANCPPNSKMIQLEKDKKLQAFHMCVLN